MERLITLTGNEVRGILSGRQTQITKLMWTQPEIVAGGVVGRCKHWGGGG